MTDAQHVDVIVIGGGPGGYAAAFRLSDLGKKVALIEQADCLGGVCLNVGCIPSKTLLHLAETINSARELKAHGIYFDTPRIAMNEVRTWKDQVIKKLTHGLAAMTTQRGIMRCHGWAQFIDAHTVRIQEESGCSHIAFETAIIAAGSEPVSLPFLPQDARIVDSTGALNLPDLMQHEFLVLGGGIIGLELATVYDAFGASVSIVEMQNQIAPGTDSDLIKPLMQRISGRYKQILLNTRVQSVVSQTDGLYVQFEGADVPVRYDRILVAVGRRPNLGKLGLESVQIVPNAHGFISVDTQMRTSCSNIFAIGDVVGQPMLAHKASYEGRLAAEVISGLNHFNDARVIPSVAYTDPEVAWVGLTENTAHTTPYEKAVFPWMASGRALAVNRSEGFTKLLYDPKTHRILGGGIVGLHAGELISEIALAIEMGCVLEDMALTIHPHPTLSESIMLAAEIGEGTITDLYIAKNKKN